MDFNRSMRLALIVMSLFPTLWGLLGLLNNISGFSGTVENAVMPLLSMQETYGLGSQTWRALTAPWISVVALLLITTTEALSGLVGAAALFQMLRHFNAGYATFSRAKGLLVLACSLAIAVWGIGFMVIANDWFLAWQRPGGSSTQLGGFLYMAPCLAAILLAGIHRETD